MLFKAAVRFAHQMAFADLRFVSLGYLLL